MWLCRFWSEQEYVDLSFCKIHFSAQCTKRSCLCSAAHQLHQPRVRQPLHGRPQQQQLPSQHRRKEGAPFPGRREHERPAGVEPRIPLNCASDRPAQPMLSPQAPSSYAFPTWKEKQCKKKKRRQQNREHCKKCIKWRTTFLSDSSIICCPLTTTTNHLVTKKDPFYRHLLLYFTLLLTSPQLSLLPSCI